jgi:MFS family permease
VDARFRPRFDPDTRLGVFHLFDRNRRSADFRDLVIPVSTVFAAFSVALIVTGLLGPAVGRLIDERGGRGALALSNGVLAAGLVLLGVAHGVLVLFAAWIVLGIGMALGLYDAAFLRRSFEFTGATREDRSRALR